MVFVKLCVGHEARTCFTFPQLELTHSGRCIPKTYFPEKFAHGKLRIKRNTVRLLLVFWYRSRRKMNQTKLPYPDPVVDR